jgi:UDP-N-acetyl-D-mannosaminuronate dehydrogenase
VAVEAGTRDADCVVIVTDHKAFDYTNVVKQARLIVDTRNALKGQVSDKIVRL